MAVSHVQSWSSHTTGNASTNQASFALFTSATVNSCKIAVVFVVSIAGTDNGSSVTWGSSSMTAFPYTASDTDTEPATIKAYYLVNPPTGTQTVTISRTNNATQMVAFGFTSNGNAGPDLEIYEAGSITQGGSSQNTAASTSGTGTGATGAVSVTDGSPGTNSLRYCCFYLGGNNLPTAATGDTRIQENDLGSYTVCLISEDTASQGAQNFGTATGLTDDRAAIYFAVREKPITVVPGSFTANAIVKANSGTKTLTADAIVKANSGTKTFTADAAIVYTASETLTADAIVLANSGTKTLTADATIKRTQTGAATADAVIKRTWGPGAYAPTVLADGPVGYWRLGEPSGTNANDEAGNNDGTYTGTYTLGLPGAIPEDTAVGFGPGYVSIPHNAAYSVGTTDELSIEGWFRVDDLTTTQLHTLIAKGGTDYEYEWELYLAADDYLTYDGPVLSLTFSANSQSDIVELWGVLPAIAVDTWYHVVVSIDAVAELAKFYLDGVLITDVREEQPWTGNTLDSTTKALQIGAYPDASTAIWLDGRADEVALYDYVLTAEQVATHYASSLGGLFFPAVATIKRTQSGSVTSDAVVKATMPGAFTADAAILRGQPGSFTVDANVFGTVSVTTLTADAAIGSSTQFQPVWVSPANETEMSAFPTLVFEMPSGMGKPMFFHIQLDKVNTFNGPDLRDVKSNQSQTGWEYWNGGTWVAVPSAGVDSSYGGNQARYTVQQGLSSGTWYRRVRAG